MTTVKTEQEGIERQKPNMSTTPSNEKQNQGDPSSKPNEEALLQAHRDLDWAREREDDLRQKYGESVIAVYHETVVAHGQNHKQVLEQAAEKQGCPTQEIVLIDLLPMAADMSPDFV